MIRIQRLNMDNSWSLGIGGLGLLIDPWLCGKETDYFSWFNTQWHRYEPVPFNELPAFDWVLITQKYPDHFHPETLLKLRPMRIMAPASLRGRIGSLLPGTEAVFMEKDKPSFDLGGVTVRWLHTDRKIDPIYDAVAIHDDMETVLVASHGFELSRQHLDVLRSLPRISLLLSPVNEYKLPFFLGGSVSPGLRGLEKLLKDSGAERFVSTHDEDKHATGLVSRLAKVIRYSADDIRRNELLGARFLNIPDYKTHML
jgi:hypothetical protein